MTRQEMNDEVDPVGVGGAASDERNFYALKSLHFEKLKGDRSHLCSMKLNDQWRLILELTGSGPEKVAVLVGIEDYH